MNRMTTSAAAAGLLAAALWMPAAAQPAPAPAAAGGVAAREAPPELPANDKAKALLDSAPRVMEARHALEAARHRAGMLAAGPYEWTARASIQRRSARGGESAASEWSAGLERPLRIGGKAALDRRLGEVEVRLAQARLGEARHEAARELLELTLTRSAASRTRQLWTEQLGFAQANFKAADIRRRAGDASLLEQNAARADLAEVQRQLSAAAGEEARAQARLRARFAALEPQTVPLGDPASLAPDDPALWRERILAESDALRTAREELQRAELTAARAGANRLADPTVGVHTGSEGGGAERIVGITLSVPLGGSYRQGQQREALTQAEAARAGVERARRELESDIAETLADAAGSLDRWKFAEQSRASAQENAQLAQRAYTLGESDLQAVLLARRQAVDAALGADQARVDALRVRYRLLIDAHLIWELDHDD